MARTKSMLSVLIVLVLCIASATACWKVSTDDHNTGIEVVPDGRCPRIVGCRRDGCSRTEGPAAKNNAPSLGVRILDVHDVLSVQEKLWSAKLWLAVC
eukprot:IDg13263t1